MYRNLTILKKPFASFAPRLFVPIYNLNGPFLQKAFSTSGPSQVQNGETKRTLVNKLYWFATRNLKKSRSSLRYCSRNFLVPQKKKMQPQMQKRAQISSV